MVKHIILWNLKDEYTDEEKDLICADIKKGLEDLDGQIPGLVDIHVQAEKLETSTVDVMLDCTLESFEALKAYAVHPKHVEVAETKIKPFAAVRSCIDFEV